MPWESRCLAGGSPTAPWPVVSTRSFLSGLLPLLAESIALPEFGMVQ